MGSPYRTFQGRCRCRCRLWARRRHRRGRGCGDCTFPIWRRFQEDCCREGCGSPSDPAPWRYVTHHDCALVACRSKVIGGRGFVLLHVHMPSLKRRGGYRRALPVLWRQSRQEEAEYGGTDPPATPAVGGPLRPGPTPSLAGIVSDWVVKRAASMAATSFGNLPRIARLGHNAWGLHTAGCARTPHRPNTGNRGEHEGGVHHPATHFNLHYTRCRPRMTDVGRPLGKTVNAIVTFGHVRRRPSPASGRGWDRPDARAANLGATVPPQRPPSPPCAEPPLG
jgi:hypothetical protein